MRGEPAIERGPPRFVQESAGCRTVAPNTDGSSTPTLAAAAAAATAAEAHVTFHEMSLLSIGSILPVVFRHLSSRFEFVQFSDKYALGAFRISGYIL